MKAEPIKGTDWIEVSAKAQALLCLGAADLPDRGLAGQARFLMKLGLQRADAAALLGTSDDSLRHVLAGSTKKTRA